MPMNLDPTASPFSCNNLPLAIALATCGCQFANADGRILAGINQYSLAFIRAQNRRECEGKTHAEAVKILWGLGIPGNAIFYFERSQKLTDICAGWDAQNASDGTALVATKNSDERDGALLARARREAAEFTGGKGVTAFWRRRDASGNPYVVPVMHRTGTATSTPTEFGTRTVIRDAAQHGVKV